MARPDTWLSRCAWKRSSPTIFYNIHTILFFTLQSPAADLQFAFHLTISKERRPIRASSQNLNPLIWRV